MFTEIQHNFYFLGLFRLDKSYRCKKKSVSKRSLMESWAEQSKSFFDNLENEVFAFQQKANNEAKKTKCFFDTLALDDEISAFQHKLHIEAKIVICKTWLQVQRDLLLDETLKTTPFLLKNNGLDRKKNWLQYQRESLLDERLIVPTKLVSPSLSMVSLTKDKDSETKSIQGLDITKLNSLDRRSSSDSRLYVRINLKINGRKKVSVAVKRRKAVLNPLAAISKKNK